MVIYFQNTSNFSIHKFSAHYNGHSMAKLQVCYFQGQLVNCDALNDLWTRYIDVILLALIFDFYSEIISHRKVAKPWNFHILSLIQLPASVIILPHSLYPYVTSSISTSVYRQFFSYVRIESNMMIRYSSDICFS